MDGDLSGRRDGSGGGRGRGGGGMEGQGARRVREMELCRFGRWTGEGKVDSERPPMNGSKGV